MKPSTFLENDIEHLKRLKKIIKED